jgi:hypothetical protein
VGQVQTTKSFKNSKIVYKPEEEWVIVKNTHEPIVKLELFEKVQKLLAVKKRPNKALVENIFVGLLFCKDCGRRMAFSSSTGAKGGGGAFICTRYRSGNWDGRDRKCTPHYIGFNRLKEIVCRNINSVIHSKIDGEKFRKKLAERENCDFSESEKLLKKLKLRQSQLERGQIKILWRFSRDFFVFQGRNSQEYEAISRISDAQIRKKRVKDTVKI